MDRSKEILYDTFRNIDSMIRNKRRSIDADTSETDKGASYQKFEKEANIHTDRKNNEIDQHL
ncbi:hypothetical protein [Desulfogranum japonicum]|uniref:hypothetical protein n=1 Tax=Desulfogranum japonicum TaxID=231447 RepID=UPI0004239990|nr:hypothetical protein [Desulfogranum japonicum]